MKQKQMQNAITELIIVRSQRLTFQPLLLSPRHTMSALLCRNTEFVAVDGKLYRSLAVCKH